MKVITKYHEILEENLREELEWLIEEFKILFKSKIEKYTEKEKKAANDILDYVLENTYVYDNIILFNLLTEAIKNIEKKYSNLL